MNKKFLEKLKNVNQEVRKSFFSQRPKQTEENQEYMKQGQEQTIGESIKDRLVKAAKAANSHLKNFDIEQKSKQFSKMGERLRKDQGKTFDQLKSMTQRGWNAFNPKLSNLKSKLDDLKVDQTKEKLTNMAKSTFQYLENANPLNKHQPSQEKELPKQKEAPKLTSSKPEAKEGSDQFKWINSKLHLSQDHWKYLRDMLQKQLKSGINFKFDLIQKVFQKMYWRLAFMIILIAFAYGFGSSIPREIRKALQKSSDARQKKKEAAASKEANA